MDGISLANISLGFLGLISATYALLTRGKGGISYATTPLIVLSLTVSIVLCISIFNMIYSSYTALTKYPPFWNSGFSFKSTGEFLGLLLFPPIITILIMFIAKMVLTDLAISQYFRVELDLFRRRMFVYPFERIILKKERDSSEPKTLVSDARLLAKKYFYGSIDEIKELFPRNEESGYSVSILYAKPKEDQFLDDLCALFIQNIVESNDTFFEIVCCTRHPIEIIDHLNGMIKSNYFRNYFRCKNVNGKFFDLESFLDHNDAMKRIIFIDAHTSNFGFDEPVYYARSRRAREYCLDVIKSPRSFPGIHSALVKGVKAIRNTEWFNDNRMGLILFDELHALSDIDSFNQYKIFVRHVVASERLMGGIMTVFCEPPDQIEKVPEIKRYFDHYFDTHAQFLDVAFPSWMILTEIDRMAEEIVADYESSEDVDSIILVPVMNGGEISANILERLLIDKFDHREVQSDRGDYSRKCPDAIERFEVRVSKYQKKADFEGEIKERPNFDGAEFDGKYVLVVDDICDRGTTIECIRDALEEFNAHVRFAVTIQRSILTEVDFSAINFYDHYPNQSKAWMYGFGMDSSRELIAEQDSRQVPCFVFERRQ